MKNITFYHLLESEILGRFRMWFGSLMLFFIVLLWANNAYSSVALNVPSLSDIGVGTARLSATISASIEPTRLKFEFGTSSTSLSSSTPEKTISTLNSSVTTSEFISDLQCDTVYYFRVAASKGGINSRTLVSTFTTNSCVTVMAVITTQPASQISQTSARLVGEISLDRVYQSVKYYFEYGFNAAYGSKTAIDSIGQGRLQATVNSDVFDLVCGNNYHYRLVVFLRGAADTSSVVKSEGNDLILTSTDCNLVELLAVSLVATAGDNVTVAADVNTHGNDADIYFQWGEAANNLTEQSPITPFVSSRITQQITRLSCGKTYFFVVVVKHNGPDIRSDPQSFTTKPCALPPTTEAKTAENISISSAAIVASVSPNEAITRVYFEWGLSSAYDEVTESNSINGSFSEQIVRADLVDLACATQYFYRAVASNEHGENSGQGLSFTTKACDATNQAPKSNVDAGVSPGSVTIKISAGENHSIAIGKDGELFSWGDNQYFQLGGPTDEVGFIDGVAAKETIFDKPLLFYNFMEVAAGGRHSLALHKSGQVLSFGQNTLGQLGTSTNESSGPQYPVTVVDALIDDKFLSDIVSIDAGDLHSIALNSDGDVFVWGDNTYGQLGNVRVASSSTPIKMTSLNNVIEISSGANFNLALLEDKSLMAWGENGSGQLGFGNISSQERVSIVALTTGIKNVTAGERHVLAIGENKSIFVWGNNQNGQLGIGNTDDQMSPVALSVSNGFEFSNVVQLAAGKNHSLALLETGELYAWGDNTFGQLGIALFKSVSTPTAVVGADRKALINIVSIAAGANFTVALDANGNILTWGDNTLGQLNGRALSRVNKIPLVNRLNTTIALNEPRIIIDTDRVEIERGSVTHINVRLSSGPDAEITVNSAFETGTKNFYVERGDRLSFTDTRVNWAYKKPLTIGSVKNSTVQSGILVFTAPGFAEVRLPVKVVADVSESTPSEQVVGALQINFILLLLGWLFFIFMIRAKHLFSQNKLR